MFKTARFLIGVGVLAGLSATGILLWLLGPLGQLIDWTQSLWSSLLGWLDNPTFSIGAVAGLGSTLAIVAVLVIGFVILTDS